MKKVCLLALAGLLVSSAVSATTITEDFSSDPSHDGWKILGETNLFYWDSTNQNLQVTWDSSKPNSFFYQPLGTILARDDDFTVEFDLTLNDAISGTEPGKTGPLEVAIGFMNLASATSTNFQRGVYYPFSAPAGAINAFEFNYFPYGYYDFGGGFIFDVVPTTTPTFISMNGYFAPTSLDPYKFDLPLNQPVHVAMNYAATNQTLAMTLTTNGVTYMTVSNVVLTDTNQSAITDSDDFRLNAFSITSYSSTGDDFDSLLAHGAVDNIVVTVPPSPVQNAAGGFSNSVWQVQFNDRTNWLYTLERTLDFQSWTNVSPATPGVSGSLSLVDTNAPAGNAFYRVRADRP